MCRFWSICKFILLSNPSLTLSYQKWKCVISSWMEDLKIKNDNLVKDSFIEYSVLKYIKCDLSRVCYWFKPFNAWYEPWQLGITLETKTLSPYEILWNIKLILITKKTCCRYMLRHLLMTMYLNIKDGVCSARHVYLTYQISWDALALLGTATSTTYFWFSSLVL